jgi:hypothetical protein
VFDRLRGAYRRGYGLDPGEPRSFAGPLPAPSFQDLARTCPFSVTGTLFFRGVVALAHERADAEALEYFRAAAAAGAAVRAALRSIGADDGETEDLTRLARVHAAYCLAGVDPEAALGELATVESGPGGAEVTSGLRPPELAAPDRIELFVRLVNAGHYTSAARLAPSVAAAVGLDAPPTPGAPGGTTPGVSGGRPPGAGAAPTLNATFCLGILALNHDGESARAAGLFARVHDGARAACATGAPGPAALALLWPARYCQALALRRAGDGAGSRAAASSLIQPIPPGPGVPPVPADLQASAQELLA